MPASGPTKSPAAEQPSLRRAVTPWGSFAWGYSDVGADIFVGLGLVLGAAAGASNVAFLFAGLVYICVGLAYTELAAAYPGVAGAPRGIGLLAGLPLHEVPVADVVAALRERGVLAGSGGGNTIRFAPPLIVSNVQIDAAVDTLRAVFEEVRLSSEHRPEEALR